jgi:hypothetical protein
MLRAHRNVTGVARERPAKAGPDAVGFFHYSGHGAADGPRGGNYLIPAEAPLTHDCWSRLRRSRAAWRPMRWATLRVPEFLDKRLYDFNFTQAAASAGQLTPLAKPRVAAANVSRSKESRPSRYLSGGSGSGGSAASK